MRGCRLRPPQRRQQEQKGGDAVQDGGDLVVQARHRCEGANRGLGETRVWGCLGLGLGDSWALTTASFSHM